MIELFLPDSGYTAFFKTSLNYGQHLEIERVQMGMAKANDEGKAELNTGGYIDYKMKIIEVMLAYFQNSVDGQPNRVMAGVPMIREFTVSDGELLEKKAMELYEGLKKKPNTTPTE